MNASLEINGTKVMFSDSAEELASSVTFGDNVSLVLNAESEAEIKRWYTELSAGGQITMTLAPTYFAQQYARLIDKFGVHWMLSLA